MYTNVTGESLYAGDYFCVDLNLIEKSEFTLSSEPSPDSELVIWNGLGLDNSNYRIQGRILVLKGIPLKIGDGIYIKYQIGE